MTKKPIEIRQDAVTVYRLNLIDDVTPVEAAYLAAFFAMTPHLNGPEDFIKWDVIERHFINCGEYGGR